MSEVVINSDIATSDNKNTTKGSDNYFSILNDIDVSGKTEEKNGLTYLSWAWAWGEVKKKFPTANYKIYEREDGCIYWTDGTTCWVKTGVTINGIEHIEYLPVMDYKNKSIPLDKVTSFDVNKAIQRSLTKACARHGLGLYIYAGEDLPEAVVENKSKLQSVIDNIGGLVDELLKTEKASRHEISDIIKNIYTVNGKKSANYKAISDIDIANKVFEELKKLEEATEVKEDAGE